MERNLRTYNKPEIVEAYAQSGNLQPPEDSIIKILEPELPHMNVLDLGVGGRRTTHHLASRAQKNIGSDYGKEMVTACRSKFGETDKQKFEEVDVRDLTRYPDDSFQFIFFSFNGLDYIGHQERLSVLNEIYRITAPGSYFAFSTHNLNSVDSLKKLHFHWRPDVMLTLVQRYLKLKRINGNYDELKDKDFAIIDDGALQFGLETYYIKPTVQYQTLESIGFEDIRAFGLKEGKELGSSEIQDNTDSWLYFLCHKPKQRDS